MTIYLNPNSISGVSSVTAAASPDPTAAVKFYNSQGTETLGNPIVSNLTASSINGGQLAGFRNLIINGNFDIWQRGTTLTNQVGILTYLADRWAIETWSSSTARLSYSQVADAPILTATDLTSGPAVGISNSSAKITVTTTSTNPTNDFGLFRQFIEGYNAQLLYKTPFVVSFWVKSNLTGTYKLGCYGGNVTPGTPGFVQTYTINSVNTWEYKSISVPASPAGTYSNWNFTNGRGMDMIWYLWTNSGNRTGTLGEWSTSSGYPNPTGSVVNLASTLNNYWQISQVQVEVGTKSTPFERRFYGQELALCQRYYWRNPDTYFPNNVSMMHYFKVEMRAVPNVTWSGVGGVIGGINTGSFNGYSTSNQTALSVADAELY